MNTVKDVREWLQKLATAQVEGVWSVRPMIRVGRKDLLRAIEVLEPFDALPGAPHAGVEAVTPKAIEMIGMVLDALPKGKREHVADACAALWVWTGKEVLR